MDSRRDEWIQRVNGQALGLGKGNWRNLLSNLNTTEGGKPDADMRM